jgi:penicillin-binding protein 1A
MVSAYSCFANKGVWVEPTYILRIEDKNGNVIFNSHPKTREALSEETAFKMVELLSGIAAYGPIIKGEKTYGTGIRLRSSAKPYGNIPYSIKIAGKTGTTQNQSDGWFMGITPDVVTGVWVGCDDRSAHFTSLRLGMGTNMALPIWGYYMNSLYKDKDLKISKDAIEKPASLSGVRFDCEEKNSDFNFNMDDIIEGGGGM